jgi:hypothetical protein
LKLLKEAQEEKGERQLRRAMLDGSISLVICDDKSPCICATPDIDRL